MDLKATEDNDIQDLNRALRLATIARNIESAKALLAQGADANAANHDGVTARSYPVISDS